MFNTSKFMNLPRLGLLICVMTVQALANDPCAFTVPEGWNQARTQWDGACEAGFANGLGVIKEQGDKNVNRFFFGRLKNGAIEFGVVEELGSYMAGRFAMGRLVQSDDRQVYIDAFAEGEKAAQQVASRFSNAGNKASARFYKGKAKALREAMD